MDPPRLFVYGTLMPGRLRWALLEPFARAHRPASAAGTLYDSGRGWPVAVFDGAPSAGVAGDLGSGSRGAMGTIPGVLVDLRPRRRAAALALLDEVEGTAAHLLQRIVVGTVDGPPAWAYHHPHGVDGLVRIAGWAAVPTTAES